MRWLLKQKNILDEQADILVCSANVHLTLSGGVGADLLARYGNAMQAALQNGLRKRSPRCAQRGEVFPYVGPELPYKAVLHAVAIDGWYDSSPGAVTDVCRRALRMAAERGARTVALTTLATGFGKLAFSEFAEGIRPLLGEDFPPVEEVAICLRLDFEVAEMARHLPEIERDSALQTGEQPGFKTKHVA
jgi:O-acetyl-ADP-ribose deacetylase (regulator of RNase III)